MAIDGIEHKLPLNLAILNGYIVKVYQNFTDTLLKNLTTDIKYTENVSVMV